MAVACRAEARHQSWNKRLVEALNTNTTAVTLQNGLKRVMILPIHQQPLPKAKKRPRCNYEQKSDNVPREPQAYRLYLAIDRGSTRQQGTVTESLSDYHGVVTALESSMWKFVQMSCGFNCSQGVYIPTHDLVDPGAHQIAWGLTVRHTERKYPYHHLECLLPQPVDCGRSLACIFAAVNRYLGGISPEFATLALYGSRIDWSDNTHRSSLHRLYVEAFRLHTVTTRPAFRASFR
jgi:hypothetical protein